MQCGLNNSLTPAYFGKKNENISMKNEPLNFGVVAPPSTLPNASLYNTVYSEDSTPKVPVKGGSKLTAGKFSAGCAFGAMALAALSLLPFIRKR